MSYLFFNDVLQQLGQKLEYEAVVNYAGNSFCSESWSMISDSNPMNVSSGNHKTKSQQTLLGILESADVKIGKVVIPGKEQGNGKG